MSSTSVVRASSSPSLFMRVHRIGRRGAGEARDDGRRRDRSRAGVGAAHLARRPSRALHVVRARQVEGQQARHLDLDRRRGRLERAPLPRAREGPRAGVVAGWPPRRVPRRRATRPAAKDGDAADARADLGHPGRRRRGVEADRPQERRSASFEWTKDSASIVFLAERVKTDAQKAAEKAGDDAIFVDEGRERPGARRVLRAVARRRSPTRREQAITHDDRC